MTEQMEQMNLAQLELRAELAAIKQEAARGKEEHRTQTEEVLLPLELFCRTSLRTL